MQTIKNINYEVERKAGNKIPTTICTITADLSYIINLFEHVHVVGIKGQANKFSMTFEPSREVKIFTKCLAHLGFSVDNPRVVYVAKITLHEGDIDDPKLADKIVRDKAHNALLKQIVNALEQATKPTFDRLSKLEAIRYRLEDVSDRSFLDI